MTEQVPSASTPEPPARARLEPLPASQWDPEIRPLMEATGPLNIFGTLARHPKLMKRWMVFGSHVLAKNSLPARERELVILRVGWRCNCPYEFGQHTLIGAREGITEEEIRRLCVGDLAGWSDADAALVAAADELVADQMISDATWSALQQRWDEHQLMDIVFTAGQYVLTCMALRSFGVQLDDGVPGFPS